MKKLFTFLSRANNNSVGIISNYCRVSSIYSMLTILVVLLMVPQGVKAEDYDKTYNFNNQGNDTELVWSSTTEEGCTYFTKIGSTESPERFAMEKDPGNRIDLSTKPGLYNGRPAPSKFLVSQLYNGDKVTFTISSSQTYGTDAELISSNATKDGNTFTMTAKGSLVVTIPRGAYLETIRIVHVDQPSFSYDPAVEIYDLYNVTGTYGTSNADFNLNGSTAKYITTLQNGMSLNNRIAIDGSNWVFNDHGLKAQGGWHNLSVCNLKEGDRVVIQYTGQATFSSAGQNGGYNGCPAFKDVDNDGEFNGQDVNISNGMTLEAKTTSYDYNVQTNTYITYAYTVTEDGHLDIGLADGSRIFKITIYGDHQARMVDRYGNDPSDGNTSYFDTTGQLEAKHHIVPGGLHVYVGNEDEAHHAEVVMSDKGPVSFVYDQSHFKMARHSNWGSVNVWDALPVTGTYYKFVPEVSGTMTVRFKANSITYHNYGIAGNAAYDQWGSPNEVTSNVGCPYYLMLQNGNTPQQISTQTKSNGADLSFSDIAVTAGQTYYIYGWWQNGTDAGQLQNYYCGVAELIDVTFKPSKYVYPLAKWVESGATVDKLGDLATVIGYTDVCVKKKSDNIESCTVAIDNNGKLKVTSISYKTGTNPGGVVLIKVGDKNNDADPVFALTIAYDASFNKPEGAARSEGHTWDFSTYSLNGLEWTNRDTQEATVTDFGTSQNSSSLLSREIAKGDWTFNYRVKASNGTTHDPRFLNNWDMEGDNADMMWDTEGLIFHTSSNQSCINNEFGGVVDNSRYGTQTDPDRYVGILPGGSFTIPALKKGDRVEIFMGSGDGSSSDACKFNITGACDAIGQTISSTDIYNGGGSMWKYNTGAESRYRGAYQFISTGGDMTFTMNGGSMTKLYTIKIYRGTKSVTVDASRPNYSTTYDGKEYKPLYQYNNDYRTSATEPQRGYFTIHYRGKGERLRTPTVVYKSGNIDTDADHLFYAEIGDNSAPFIFFKSEKQQYGMFRIRIDDMELNNKYVADYALQNVTVGYLQNKTYPYTWDFTDIKSYVEENIQQEQSKVGKYGNEVVITGVSPKTADNTNYIEFMNNSVGENVKAVEQWKSYAKNGDIPAGYGLQINNEPYSGGVMWNEGQLYAGSGIFAESFGLSIKVPEYVDDKGEIQREVNQSHNGDVRICDEGLCLTGGNWTIMIPEVATNKAVYVRAKQVGKNTIYAAVGDVLNNTSFTYVGEANDITKDKIYAVMGTGGDLKLMFNNLIIKKIAISEDPKTVNHLGYATESRNQEIDPELMGYMTGTGLKAYTITEVNYGKNAGDIPSITLTEILPANVMGPAGPTSEKDHRAYIIYNTDDAVTAPTGTATDAMDANGKTKAVNILGGGFHLFYPDMHDRSNAVGAKKSMLKTEVKEGGKNYLRSHITSGDIDPTEDDYTNYLMNYKYYDRWGRQQKGPEAFYRAGEGARLGDNKAYLQLETDKVRPENYSDAKQGFAIIFVNEEKGITTTVLDGVKTTEMHISDNAIYTLSGMKVNNPQKGGIYVKNGKKIVIK